MSSSRLRDGSAMASPVGRAAGRAGGGGGRASEGVEEVVGPVRVELGPGVEVDDRGAGGVGEVGGRFDDHRVDVFGAEQVGEAVTGGAARLVGVGHQHDVEVVAFGVAGDAGGDGLVGGLGAEQARRRGSRPGRR